MQDWSTICPASAHEVEYWCLCNKPRAVLILDGSAGVLCLPRKEGTGSRKLIDVSREDVEKLRERGWRDYRTHMLPPEGYDAAILRP